VFERQETISKMVCGVTVTIREKLTECRKNKGVKATGAVR